MSEAGNYLIREDGPNETNIESDVFAKSAGHKHYATGKLSFKEGM